MAINFTNKNLDNLPFTKKRQSIKDEKSRGLYLKITAKGKKTFSLIRSVMGKNFRHYIGVYPDVKIAQARQRATELNSQIDTKIQNQQSEIIACIYQNWGIKNFHKLPKN